MIQNKKMTPAALKKLRVQNLNVQEQFSRSLYRILPYVTTFIIIMNFFLKQALKTSYSRHREGILESNVLLF